MCDSLSESLLTTLAELVAVNWQVSFQCRSSVFLTVALPLHAKQGQWTCLYIFSLQSQPEISSLDQGTFTPSGIIAHKAKETRNIVRKFCLHEPPCFFLRRYTSNSVAQQASLAKSNFNQVEVQKEDGDVTKRAGKQFNKKCRDIIRCKLSFGVFHFRFFHCHFVFVVHFFALQDGSWR